MERFEHGFLGEARALALGRGEVRHGFGAGGVDGRIAFGLYGDRVGLPQVVLDHATDGLFGRFLVWRLEVARLLGSLLGQADDGVDHRLEARMAGHHRLEHVVFGELARLRFHHQHGVLRAGHDKVERRGLHLVGCRVQLELAVDHADAGCADRTHEGNARECQGRRRGDHGEDVRIVLEIVRQNGHDDLRVEEVTLREQRPDRTIDQP